MIDVKKISKLANLPLSDEEQYRTELEETIKYIENLQEVDTEKVVGTSQVTGKTNALREDSVDKNRIVPKKTYVTKQVITY